MPGAGRALSFAGSLLLSAALLGACTDSSDPIVAPSTTTAPSGEVVEGGTLRVGLGDGLHPDPATANLGSPADMMVLDLLYDGLTRLDEKGAATPALALAWEPDATLTHWTFHLDPEATFTSGRPVTSADVLASLERVARGGDSSLAALRLESITGFRAFVDGTTISLAGLTAPDPATVVVALDTPMSVLPVVLASPVFGMVDTASLDAATADGADAAAVGALDLYGAWSIAESSDDVLTLERRPGAAGHLDAVQLRLYSDAEAAYDAFDDGDVDWALVPSERYDDAVDDHGDDHFAPFQAELFFGLRVGSPSLANPDLRRAIAAAIDREAIVSAVYPDLAQPLAGVVPAGVPGHVAEPCEACRHDPDHAKELLAAAFPDGNVPTVAIDFDESAAQSDMAQMVADDLKAVGIPTTLRPKPLDEYKAFVVSGAQELFSFGWIGGYPSPDAYLAPLFATTANDNLPGYASPEADAALAAARATADPAAAAAQWTAVEARVLGDAVVVPIAQFRTQAVVGERVEALDHAVDGSVDWAAVWVADGA